jgi:hypothetical protein
MMTRLRLHGKYKYKLLMIVKDGKIKYNGTDTYRFKRVKRKGRDMLEGCL